MLIYNYHPDSGEFMGSSQADPNPAREKIDPENVDDFLIPAHATILAPPTPAPGHAAAFRNGEWIDVPDHRGEIWWNDKGEEMTVQQLGDPLDHGLLREPPEIEQPGRAYATVRPDGTCIQIAWVEEGVLHVKVQDGYQALADKGMAVLGYKWDGTQFVAPQE